MRTQSNATQTQKVCPRRTLLNLGVSGGLPFDAVVGLATPNGMKPYINDGCVRDTILWNPVDLGYAAVYVTRAIVDGEFMPGDSSVMAGRLGELMVVNGSEVLLGPPFVFTAENINDFDF